MIHWLCRFIFFVILIPAFGSESERATFLQETYEKTEFRIPMRDAVRLHTVVYAPKEGGPYPIILLRSPYSAGPYGDDGYRSWIAPNPLWEREKFIFVFQDVRGRFMSEGFFMNVRPKARRVGKKAPTDDNTDTYDTIAWLLKNIDNHNGKVGQWGISYPGYYTAVGMYDNHPALKIASPQAPIADWYWDDMHHNGAFSLHLAFNFFSSFGVKRKGLTRESEPRFNHGTPDGYQFFLDLGPLSNVNERHFHGEIPFWNDLVEHPNYDDFWQARNLLPRLNNVNCAVMTVGGWFDAEDLYGPLNIYREVEKNNPGIHNILVMGPWGHGGWARTKGNRLGDNYFGMDSSDYYQQEVELPLFKHYLKGTPAPQLKEAIVFDTGCNQWHQYDEWPPTTSRKVSLYLHTGGGLGVDRPSQEQGYEEFVSDPAKPVPSTTAITTGWGKAFMGEDQRHAARRPDVLVFASEPLQEDLTIVGPLKAFLRVSTSASDADWVVKIVDGYPGDSPNLHYEGAEVDRGHAQLLVRYEIIRGRYRESFETPKPFVPYQPTLVPLKLQDIYHTFKKGHRLMIHIQSTYFPFFDRNPQIYVENIFKASASDFVKANHRVYLGGEQGTRLDVNLLPAKADP